MASKPLTSLLGALWRVLDAVRKALHLILLLALALFIVALASRELPLVPREAALVIAPVGDLVEQLDGDPLDRALSELAGEARPQALLADLIRAIEAAKDDSRIDALVLELEQLDGAGLSKLQTVAAALESFKSSGKPVIAAGDYYLQNQYYLAAHADEVYLHPLGLVYFDGYGRYRMFYREAIERLAIDWNVFKVGEYKSFVEPYIRDSMSEEDKEASLAWLNELWSSYMQDVTGARELAPDAISGYVAGIVAGLERVDGDFALLARETGLVDEIRSRDEVEDRLAEIVGRDSATGSYRRVGYLDYLRGVDGEPRSRSAGNVGVIVAAGEILDGEQPPGTIGAESLSALIRQARTDEGIEALVLRVDSPGGSQFASEIIARELALLREGGKPLVVSMSSTAASGGYWIAAPADQIWAAPTTLTGSIGVFAMFPTFQRTLDKIGIHVDGVGTTALSGQLRFDRELGEQARRLIELGIENGYRRFVERVAEARDLGAEEVERLARGRVWTGAQALELGLVDRLGRLEEAIAAAAELAGLGADHGVRYIDKPLSLSESIAISLAGRVAGLRAGPGAAAPAGAPLGRALTELREQFAGLWRFNDPRGLYAYCFCRVE